MTQDGWISVCLRIGVNSVKRQSASVGIVGVHLVGDGEHDCAQIRVIGRCRECEYSLLTSHSDTYEHRGAF
jgi:hypothetical protein